MMRAFQYSGAVILVSAISLVVSVTMFCGYGGGRAFAVEEPVYAKDEKTVVATAMRSIPYLKEFRELYPEATVGTGYPASVLFNKDNEHEMMQRLYIGATVGLHSRYVLTMTVVFKMTADQKRVTSYGEPEFRVQEVGPITVSPNGQAHICYGRADDFDYAKFKVLKTHGGDFESIGLKLVKDKPVANFEREWKVGER